MGVGLPTAMTKTQGEVSNEPKYFRCSDKKRHLVSVFVCLHKKCPSTDCGFHRKSALSGDRINSVSPDPFLDVEPINGIRASKKRGR